MEWKDETDLKDRNFGFFIKGMKTLWKLLGDQKKNIIFVVSLVFFLEILKLSVPYSLKLIFDELPKVIKNQQISLYLIMLIIAMFSLRFLDTILHFFVREIRFLKSLITLENRWPILAQKKLLGLSIGYHERENTGKKISKINKGCDKLVDILATLYWQILPQLFYLIINIIIIIFIDWRLGLLFVFPFIPAVCINIYTYKRFWPVWENWEEKKELAAGFFCQSLINIQTVQNFTQEKKEKEKFSAIRKNMEKIDFNVSFVMQKYFAIMNMILHLFFLITIIVGIYFTYNGTCTIGTIIYIITTGNLTIFSLWGIVNSYLRILRDIVAVNRMEKLLKEKSEIKNHPEAIIPKIYKGRFEFNNVGFIYPKKDDAVFENIKLSTEPKKIIALVGKSGEGKTTIIRLLARVYDVNSGKILLDGIDIRRLNLQWYRKLFAIVSQDTDIFDASLRDNICYSVPDASESQVKKALEAAHLKSVVKDKQRFPEGLDTQVGDRGIRLSGGERQRVGIARAYIALLNGAQVLILDEATSNLDSEAEKAIQFMINGLRKEIDISIVVIAHRLSTIQKADTIYVLDNGSIVEKGNHKSLTKKYGIYYRLAEMQKIA